jgi:hypothetical protein
MAFIKYNIASGKDVSVSAKTSALYKSITKTISTDFSANPSVISTASTDPSPSSSSDGSDTVGTTDTTSGTTIKITTGTSSISTSAKQGIDSSSLINSSVSQTSITQQKAMALSEQISALIASVKKHVSDNIDLTSTQTTGDTVYNKLTKLYNTVISDVNDLQSEITTLSSKKYSCFSAFTFGLVVQMYLKKLNDLRSTLDLISVSANSIYASDGFIKLALDRLTESIKAYNAAYANVPTSSVTAGALVNVDNNNAALRARVKSSISKDIFKIPDNYCEFDPDVIDSDGLPIIKVSASYSSLSYKLNEYSADGTKSNIYDVWSLDTSNYLKKLNSGVEAKNLVAGLEYITSDGVAESFKFVPTSHAYTALKDAKYTTTIKILKSDGSYYENTLTSSHMSGTSTIYVKTGSEESFYVRFNTDNSGSFWWNYYNAESNFWWNSNKYSFTWEESSTGYVLSKITFVSGYQLYTFVDSANNTFTFNYTEGVRELLFPKVGSSANGNLGVIPAYDKSTSFTSEINCRQCECLYSSDADSPYTTWADETIVFIGSITDDTCSIVFGNGTGTACNVGSSNNLSSTIDISRSISFTPYGGTSFDISISGTLSRDETESNKSSTATTYSGSVKATVGTETLSKTINVIITPVYAYNATTPGSYTVQINNSKTSLTNASSTMTSSTYLKAINASLQAYFTMTPSDAISSSSSPFLKIVKALLCITDYLKKWKSDITIAYDNLYSNALSIIDSEKSDLEDQLSSSVSSIASVIDTYTAALNVYVSTDSNFDSSYFNDITNDFSTLKTDMESVTSDSSTTSISEFENTLKSWVTTTGDHCLTVLSESATALESLVSMQNSISVVCGFGNKNDYGNLYSQTLSVMSDVVSGNQNGISEVEAAGSTYLSFSIESYSSWLNTIGLTLSGITDAIDIDVFALLYATSICTRVTGTDYPTVYCLPAINAVRKYCFNRLLNLGVFDIYATSSDLKTILTDMNVIKDTYGIDNFDYPNYTITMPLVSSSSSLASDFDAYDMTSGLIDGSKYVSKTTDGDFLFINEYFPQFVDLAYICLADHAADLLSYIKTVFGYYVSKKSASSASETVVSFRKISPRDLVVASAFGSALSTMYDTLSSASESAVRPAWFSYDLCSEIRNELSEYKSIENNLEDYAWVYATITDYDSIVDMVSADTSLNVLMK